MAGECLADQTGGNQAPLNQAGFQLLRAEFALMIDPIAKSILMFALHKSGYTGDAPSDRCLGPLIERMKEIGVKKVIAEINDDSGLLVVPNGGMDAPWIRNLFYID